MNKPPIVFIHGLWIHGSAWAPWADYFHAKGYASISPAWPGDAPTVAECRANPGPIGNRGVVEIADQLEKAIGTLSAKPIVIGHSFGGLLAQILLGRGVAVAGVAIDPAPMKGVWQLPLSALRASFPVLGNPANRKRAVSLTFNQFRYGFANAIPLDEARELYDRWTIPAPGKPLFQAALASITGSETQVNTGNTTRGPLLITGGEKDHIAPPVLGKASAKKYNASVVTEFKIFSNRGHSLTLDHGWPELAEYISNWLEKNRE